MCEHHQFPLFHESRTSTAVPSTLPGTQWVPGNYFLKDESIEHSIVWEGPNSPAAQLDFFEGSTEGLPSSLQLVPLQHVFGVCRYRKTAPASLQQPFQTTDPFPIRLSPTAVWDPGTLSLLEREGRLCPRQHSRSSGLAPLLSYHHSVSQDC